MGIRRREKYWNSKFYNPQKGTWATADESSIFVETLNGTFILRVFYGLPLYVPKRISEGVRFE